MYAYAFSLCEAVKRFRMATNWQRVAVPGGQELAVGAVDEAQADSPLHGGNGVAADAGVILKADEVLGERHGVHALIDGVVEQELRKLLTSDGLVRLKGRGGRAAGDLVSWRPRRRLLHNSCRRQRR